MVAPRLKSFHSFLPIAQYEKSPSAAQIAEKKNASASPTNRREIQVFKTIALKIKLILISL